jgi:hypothetical protein
VDRQLPRGGVQNFAEWVEALVPKAESGVADSSKMRRLNNAKFAIERRCKSLSQEKGRAELECKFPIQNNIILGFSSCEKAALDAMGGKIWAGGAGAHWHSEDIVNGGRRREGNGNRRRGVQEGAQA